MISVDAVLPMFVNVYWKYHIIYKLWYLPILTVVILGKINVKTNFASIEKPINKQVFIWA